MKASPTTPHETPASTKSTKIVLATKLALMAVIAMLMISNLRAMISGLSAEEAVPSPQNADAAIGLRPPLDFAASLSEGSWELVDFPWSLRICSVRESLVEVKLRETFPATYSDLSDSDNSRVATDAALLVALERLGASVIETTEEGALLILNQEDCRAVVFVRDSPLGRRILAARFAIPDPDGWRLIEATPRRSDSGFADDTVRSLLASGVDLIATRGDASGQLRGLLALCTAAPESLAQDWRAVGWRVEPLKGPHAGRGGRRLAVRRGDDFWIAELPANRGGSLLLTSASNDGLSLE